MYWKLILNKIKILFIMALFTTLFLVLFCSIFIKSTKNEINNDYNIGEDSIIKHVDGQGLVVEGDNIVKLYDIKQDKVLEIPLEEYIVGVVSAEVQANFEVEAIKAQAVAARTFYLSKRLNNCPKAHGAEICNSTHCQVYMSKEERMNSWSSSERESNWNKINEAVKETEGQVLTYDDELVRYPQFFSTSSGKTEDAIDVFSNDIPYLKSIDSPGEEISPKYEEAKEITYDEFVSKVNNSYNDAKMSSNNIESQINILSRTEASGIKEIKLGDKTISGVEFRKLFGLNSTNVEFEFNSGKIKLDCKGYGHGVGMSQWGANVMAKEGKNYNEILKHYYTGVNIDKIIFSK